MQSGDAVTRSTVFGLTYIALRWAIDLQEITVCYVSMSIRGALLFRPKVGGNGMQYTFLRFTVGLTAWSLFRVSRLHEACNCLRTCMCSDSWVMVTERLGQVAHWLE